MRPGHPLHGRTLPVDRRIARRRDGNVQVLLPDGSAAVVPLSWTDSAIGAGFLRARGAHLDVDALRALIRLVDELASRP